MRIDLRQYELLHARAHRERAEAVHALIFAPIGRFLARLFARGPERVVGDSHHCQAHAS